ncbi:hypothetical protein STCU_05043 [Strigomonas culicis]|uniref:CBF1-interacting co-repressor CIR N-terminal domain-containing protein n=1 Tax=Strigomonas culicis TaxID=28005 RepID=S9UCK2_9TRYP|nr:hypothetical protein STCU_07137 [Strigomonas culicis]EPY28537.1 hypothetical protein STCU_05043 [Strigomonas culicis]|eukprot:EPY24524.1 hypothetical protein STCU_07137 [Strigomonas culicis]
MYKASSKDINRNKSFHPLSAANLGKVERLQAEEKQREQKKEERRQQLLRDQEEARYGELGLVAEAHAQGRLDGGDGAEANSQLYFKKPVRNIFEAEDRAEAERKRHAEQQAQEAELRALQEEPEEEGGARAVVSRGHGIKPEATVLATHPLGRFMNKFKKEESEAPHEAAPSTAGTSGSASTSQKRGRSAEEEARGPKTGATATGYIHPSRAAELRKELDHLQKKRLDPMNKVRQHQNHQVAEAARIERQRQQHASTSGTQGQSNNEMQERIRALLELKKKKN